MICNKTNSICIFIAGISFGFLQLTMSCENSLQILKLTHAHFTIIAFCAILPMTNKIKRKTNIVEQFWMAKTALSVICSNTFLWYYSFFQFFYVTDRRFFDMIWYRIGINFGSDHKIYFLRAPKVKKRNMSYAHYGWMRSIRCYDKRSAILHQD